MDAHKSSATTKLVRLEKRSETASSSSSSPAILRKDKQENMVLTNEPCLDKGKGEKKMASPTSSPSHDFSFTISLHPNGRDHCRASPAASFAIDLSPADDIFFHGHLLPLHLLSHISSSATSCEKRESGQHRKPTSGMAKKKLPNCPTSPPAAIRSRSIGSPVNMSRVRSKPKSFSLFRLSKWRRPGDRKEEKEKEEAETTKAAAGFDVGRALKRYAKVLFKEKPAGEKADQLRRQPHTFSISSTSKGKDLADRRRRGGGKFSAPASLTTSPTNSGILVATATISSSNDSTMEELQSAIQAAIAHCKNSSK